MTMSASRSAVITSTHTSTPTSASTTTAPTTYTTRRSAGSGLATWWVSSGRFLRVRAYCVRPIAMPNAAAAKPQWKPASFCSSPVSSGPSRAPMLMPM